MDVPGRMTPRMRVAGCAALVALASAGCGSSDTGTSPSHSGGAGGDAASGGSGGTGATGTGGVGTGGGAGTSAGGAGGASGGDSGAGDASLPDAADSGPDGGWPATGPCFGVPVIEGGVVPLDGTQHMSSGFAGNNILIVQIVAPPSGSSNITFYEYATPAVWRKVWLSEHRCDMTATGSPAFAQSIGPNLYFSSNPGGDGGLFAPFAMIPGHTYYVMVKNELLSGTPSCGAGQVCDVAFKAYPPS